MCDETEKLRSVIRLAQRARRTGLVALWLVLFIAISQASGTAKHRQVSPEIERWIKALADQNGIGCCATADGLKPQKISWDIAEGAYRVKVGKQWLFVPDEAVVKGPNRLGYAVVWLESDWDIGTGEKTTFVRCFLPGPLS